MVDDGILEETKYLLSHGLTEHHQSLKAIGYKELLPFINNEKSLEECLEKLKQNTRHYAKRQITFMNQFPNIIKIDMTNISETTNKILNIIEENKWIN